MLYEDEVLAEGHTLPCPWDGTPDGLGDGIDAVVSQRSIRTQRARAAGGQYTWV